MKSRLFINGYKLDLKDDISIPITYVSSDIKHATERVRNHSKTIVLPATANNKSVFESVWKLNYKTIDNGLGYDATGRTECQLYSNDIKVFDGLFQLKKIVRLADDYEIHGVLYSNITDLMNKVGKFTIGELGWSEYDHDLTQTNIVNSWITSTSTVQRPQGTSVANSHQPFASAYYPAGFGPYYGLADWGLAGEERQISHFSTTNSYPTWEHNEIPPLFFVKEIMYKIFELAGYTYSINEGGSWNPLDLWCEETTEPATGTTRNWISNGLYSQLVLGYEGGQRPNVSTAEKTSRNVNLVGNYPTADFDQSIQTPAGLPASIDYASYGAGYSGTLYKSGWTNVWNVASKDSVFTTSAITDSLGQFVASDGRITIANGGKYKFTWTGDYDLSYILTTNGGNAGIEFDVSTCKFYFGVNHNGVQKAVEKVVLPVMDSGTKSTTGSISVSLELDLDLQQGDVIAPFVGVQSQLEWWEIDDYNTYQWDYANYVTSRAVATSQTTFDLSNIDTVYQTGNSVDFSTWAPKLTVEEFLKGFIRMFNIFIDEPDENNHIKMWTYNEYYQDQTDAINWTDKLDKSKPIEIIPASNIEGKYYKFQFTEETDDLNQFYKNRMKEGYGNRKYTVGSTFQKGDKVFQLPFAQSVLVEKTGGSVGTNTMTVPRILDTSESTSYARAYSGAPRIFLVGLGEESDLMTGSWTLRGTTAPKLPVQYTSYPFIGHLWFTTPGKGGGGYSFDINFSTPIEQYWTPPVAYNALNLWQAHHKKFIEELTDVDSKILIAYMNLTEEDINQLDFGTIINIDGVAWKLNVIHEWRVGGSNSYKCEFFKYLNIEQNEVTQTDLPPPTIPPQYS